VRKTRYDKHVMSKQTLRRAFSGVKMDTYPTIAKFLPSIFDSQVIFSKIDNQLPDESNSENNLTMLDQLITNTLAKRSDRVASNVGRESTLSPNGPQVSTRAKEILVDQTQAAENAPVEEVVEQIETAVEAAPNPEISKLSQELQEVSKESQERQKQAEIAEKQREIDHLAQTIKTPVAVSDRPVVVLPITAKSKEEAKFKSTKYSVRWLLEWCDKIKKMFLGAVVYKEEVENL